MNIWRHDRLPWLKVGLAGTLTWLAGVVAPLIWPKRSLDGVIEQAAAESRDGSEDGPSVEVVVAAYLESSVIGETIDRLREQLVAWGGEGTITVVASDSETAHASKKADKVLQVEAEGKPQAVNRGVEDSKADIIVLMDANCRVQAEDWPRRVVDDLGYAQVVSGVKAETGGRESLYWAYEKLAKAGGAQRTESLGVVGEFLAFRRDSFVRIPRKTICDDLFVAISAMKRGQKVVVDSSICTIEPSVSWSDQVERRTRIVSGQLVEAVPELPALLASRVGRQYLGHKLYRISIGAVGFWVGMIGVLASLRPLGQVGLVSGLVGFELAAKNSSSIPPFVASIANGVALQRIPLKAAVRTLSRRSVSGGWKKVRR